MARDLRWSGPNIVELPPDMTKRWLGEFNELLTDMMREAGDIDELPLAIRQAFERVHHSCVIVSPLLEGALSLPPEERLRTSRAPRYAELLAQNIEAQVSLLMALWAAQHAWLSDWLRAEGETKGGIDR